MAKRPFLLKKQPLVAARRLAQTIPPKTQWQYNEPEVDVDDIQGDAFLGFNKPHLAILAIDIADDTTAATNTKKWLTDYVIPYVTTARDVIQFRDMFRMMREIRGGIKPMTVAEVCFNVSFSYDALLKLAPVAEVKTFYQSTHVAFKIGLPYRSPILQDPLSGEGANTNWVVGKGTNPHILIQIASDRTCIIQEEIDRLQSGLATLGNPATITYQEYGKRRHDLYGHEHFGFLDGISNMGLRGTYTEQGTDTQMYITPRFLHDTDTRKDLYGLPGQLLVWPGEVILGLPKQYQNTTGDAADPSQPGETSFIGPEWAKNGTYLVYRRLKQDVPKFWKFMKDSADKISKQPGMTGFTKEHMGAKVISRWQSGTPIIRKPHKDNPELGSDRLANNAFQYVSDQAPFKCKPDGQTDKFPLGKPDVPGMVCPLASHLRKVQPRDAGTDIGSSLDTLKHVVIRRGIEYGDPIEDVMVDDGKDRGLMFVAYQANIDKQFEFLITHWANSDTNPHDGGGHDMVIGQAGNDSDTGVRKPRVFDVPTEDGTIQLRTADEWVIPTGGGYFFVPSISALTNVIAKI